MVIIINCIVCRMQRHAMIELTSFHDKLLSTVSFEEGFLLSGVSPDHVQNMCLDVLIWITNIQMNDPDTRYVSNRTPSRDSIYKYFYMCLTS